MQKSIAQNKEKIKSKISKKEKRYKKLTSLENKRHYKRELHDDSNRKNKEKMSKYRMVCVKNNISNGIERMMQYKAEKLVKDYPKDYLIVPKFYWKRHLNSIRKEKKGIFNDGLQILPFSNFPYKKSEYTGISRKDRRKRQSGRIYSRNVNKIYVPAKYKTEEFVISRKTISKGKENERTVDKKILRIVKEKYSYTQFCVFPLWKEVEITFFKNTDNPIKHIIMKKDGFEKVEYNVEVTKPVIEQVARTLYLNIIPSIKTKPKKIKLKNGEKILNKKIKVHEKVQQ